MDNDELSQVITGIALVREKVRLRQRTNKVIKAGETSAEEPPVFTVGGDDENGCEEQGAPAIIIERKGDFISKITVKCPCGRHAELICDYGDENDQKQNS